MAEVRQLRVVVADAHEHYRNGLLHAIAEHPRLRLGAVADDGLAALSLIVRQRPDLALLDVRLPRLDGFAISQRLLSSQPPLPTRVLLLTAVLDETQRARARGVGAVGCLGKDVPRAEICETLISAAERGQARENGNERAEVTATPLAVRRMGERHPGPDDCAA